jgi:hypothetical protein
MELSWKVQRALDSFRSFADAFSELTEQEVLDALEFESSTRRRVSIMDRLISKAGDFHRQHYLNSLKEKYYGSRQNCCSEQD